MEICIDFDGTCVTHEFPEIGKEIGAVRILKRLVNNNHQLILFTMRGDKYLNNAVEWFKKHDIELFGVNKNPTQESWTSSPKAYGQLYIDDAALGAPLVNDPNISLRPFVNWNEVEIMLIDKGFLPVK